MLYNLLTILSAPNLSRNNAQVLDWMPIILTLSDSTSKSFWKFSLLRRNFRERNPEIKILLASEGPRADKGEALPVQKFIRRAMKKTSPFFRLFPLPQFHLNYPSNFRSEIFFVLRRLRTFLLKISRVESKSDRG